ncbi:hypothetical protein CBL_08103 [Carabus blaptoides fortunei]
MESRVSRAYSPRVCTCSRSTPRTAPAGATRKLFQISIVVDMQILTGDMHSDVLRIDVSEKRRRKPRSVVLYVQVRDVWAGDRLCSVAEHHAGDINGRLSEYDGLNTVSTLQH